MGMSPGSQTSPSVDYCFGNESKNYDFLPAINQKRAAAINDFI